MFRLLQRLACLFFTLAATASASAQPLDLPLVLRAAHPSLEALTGQRVACVNGEAAGFACKDVDLMAFLPISAMGGALNADTTTAAELSDIWGWTDRATGKEYAIVTRTDGTAFVDITDPTNPAYLGFLRGTQRVKPGSRRFWRDAKVYADHVFVVSEENGHGMQVFDLRQLRGLGASPSRVFSESGRYDGISRAHNIVINEESGFAYAVGSRSADGGPNCGPGLHMIDIRTPAAPTYAGCYTNTATGRFGNGYSHDAQCVIYAGPDARFTGREICLGSNETALNIADVTDKANPQTVGTLSYPSVAYAHQGWLSEDHRYFFMDDELDETSGFVTQTRTLVFDLLELDSPVLLNQHAGASTSIDHNQYVVGRYSFQANYTSGLRILDVSDPTNLQEVAFFDTFTPHDLARFSCGQAERPTFCGYFVGLWSVYPFFASRTVVVSDIEQGLFVLRPTALDFSTAAQVPAGWQGEAIKLYAPSTVVSEPTALTLSLPQPQAVRVHLYDATGRQVRTLSDATYPAGNHTVVFDPSGLSNGTYFARAVAGGKQHTLALVVVR